MIYLLTMSRLEGAYEQAADRLNAVDTRLDSMDARLNSMDRHIADLRQEMHRGFAWLMGGIATSWVTMMLAILFRR